MESYYNLCDIAEHILTKYNVGLVNDDIEIKLYDYVLKNANEYNIDIEILNDFLSYVNISDFVIHHKKLQQFGVLNNIKDSYNVKQMLQQYDFIENIDYIVEEKDNTNGGKKQKIYKLKPRTFKLCLMRSLKTRKYAEYYLFLETCIKYYNDYQLELQKARKDKIEKEYELSKRRHKKTVDDLYILVNKINADNEKYQQVIENTNDTVNELLLEAEDSKYALTKISKKLKIATIDREPRVKDEEKSCVVVVLKNNDKKEVYTYHVLRAQIKYVKRKLKEYMAEHPKSKIILQLNNVTNSVTLWNRIKENNKMISYTNNGFNIKKEYTQRQVLENISEIYNQKYIVTCESDED